MRDEFDLERFVAAQEGPYASAREELSAGRKRSHWMWYVFPQISGLGSSWTARRYAIGSLAEAKAYVNHEVLGRRLRECVELTLAIDGRTAADIFPSPDDLKFRSSLTLFEVAAPDQAVFGAAIEKYFGGARDTATIEILRGLGDLPSF